jgi:hypothetical protein
MTGLKQRVSAEDTTQQAEACRRRIEVPAEQVVADDLMRDRGVLRHVAGLGPSMVEFSLVVFFGEADDFDDQLCVPLHQTVSVWRVHRDQ